MKQDNNKTKTLVKQRAKEQFISSFIIEKRRNKEEEMQEIKILLPPVVAPSVVIASLNIPYK